MTAQSGKDLLIKISTSGGATYETVAGLRATRLSFNADTVDVTHVESEGWRELLGAAGIKSAAVSGSGVFRDEATDARVRELFFAGETPDYQIVIPSFGTIQGPFQITSVEYGGAFDGEATYDLSLASAGPLLFTAL